MSISQFSMKEMQAKLVEVFTVDQEDEEQRQIGLFKGLFWSSLIISKWICFYVGGRESISDEAELAHRNCIESVLDRIIEANEIDEYDRDDLYRFCRYEVLSYFPDIYGDESDEWTEEVIKIFQTISCKYPMDLLYTILGMIEYANKYVGSKIAEDLLANYMKNCQARFGVEEQVFSLICCVAIGRCAVKLQPEFAIELYDEYLPHMRKTDNMIDFSDALSMTAPILIKTNADKALMMLQEALQIRRSEFGDDNMIVGTTYCQISAIHQVKRDHLNAIATAIKAYKAIPEKDQTIQLGYCLIYLVHSYFEIGKHEETPEWLDIVGNIYQKNQDQPGALDLFLELSLASGNYCMYTNQPGAAEKHYREGIVTCEKNDPTNSTLDRLKLNLSILLGRTIGDIQTAEELLQEKIYAGEFKASGSNALSLMWRSMAIYATTGFEFEKAAKRSLDELMADPDCPSHMQKCIYVRALLGNQKHHMHKKEIERLISESEEEIIRLGLQESESMADLLANKAIYSYLLNKYGDAEKFSQEALCLLYNSYLLHEWYLFYGQLLAAMGKGEKALDFYNNALTNALDRLNTAKKYLNESRVRDYLNIIRVIMNCYFSLTTGEVFVGHEEQYNTVLKTKALPSLIEIVKKDTSIKTPMQKQILDQIDIIKEQSPPDIEQQIFNLEIEYAAADTAVLKFPETRCELIQKKMPRRSAIIEFFEYYELKKDIFHSKLEDRIEHRWYAVFLTIKDANGNISFRRVRDVDSLFVSVAAKDLRNAIEHKDKKMASKLQKKLYNLMFKDIRSYLSECKQLYIAPDSDLATIPFEIIGTKGFLIDDFNITYLETGRDISTNSGFVDLKGMSVVVGDPQYVIEKENRRSENIRDLYTPRRDDSDGSIKSLPFSILEAQMVAKKIGANPFLGEQATKYTVLNAEHPKVIHIATHGVVEDLDVEDDRIPVNPMTQSYLLMAGGVSEKDRIQFDPKYGNGLLSAVEVSQKDLASTDLVVLSACVTGLGKKVYSEIVGMRAAFKVAGAKNIIVSLWNVSDFATAIFMEYFYTILENKEIQIALRETKRFMRTASIRKLKEVGWLSDEKIAQIPNKSAQNEVRKLAQREDSYKPFDNEYSWAGFICQMN